MVNFVKRLISSHGLWVLFSTFATSFIVLIQAGQSPFSPEFSIATDSGIFIYGAQQILQGDILYRDLFDNKGPVLYLINMVGLIIGQGSYVGIWILEIFSFWLTLLLSFRSLRLFHGFYVSWIGTLCLALPFYLFLDEGNLTEEWSLPLIAGALHCFLSLLKNDRWKWWNPLSIGFSFVLVFLLRPNNPVVWGYFGILLLGIWIFRKEYLSGLKYIAFVGVGILLAAFPFIAYFYDKGALDELIFAVFRFNASYSDIHISHIFKRTVQNLMALQPRLGLTPLVVTLVYPLLCYGIREKEKKRIQISLWGCFIVSLFSAHISPYHFAHYYQILTPLYIFPIGLSIDYLYASKSKWMSKGTACFPLLILCAVLTVQNSDRNKRHREELSDELREIGAIVKNNSQPDQSILVANCSASIYLVSDRKAASTYYAFGYQSQNPFVGKEITDLYFNDIKTNRPVLIILNSEKESADSNFAPVRQWIETNYKEIHRSNLFRVMRIRS